MTTETKTKLTQFQAEIPGHFQSLRIDQLLKLEITITWEYVLVGLIGILAVVTRFWNLGARVMSHDESLHVYYSWLLASGKGFVHNPMMHGPFLFEATALMNFLFGASDFTSRLVPAILGVFIVVVIPHLLKPWLGKIGEFVTSVFLLISPFILYFSRYIRHDILVITWVLLAIVAIFRYLETRRDRDLLLLAISIALMVSTMEIAFIYLAILAGYLFIHVIATHQFGWKNLRKTAEFDLLVILTTLGAFFSSPIALLILNPIWVRLTGSPFVGLALLNNQGTAWSTGVSGARLWGLFGIFSISALMIGLWWDWKRWLKLAGVFAAITLPLFTTFFTNLAGLGTGFIGSLGYWISQQGVARGSQPWYYYLLVFPLYEYLPLIGGFFAGVTYLVRRKYLSPSQNSFILFMIWWGIGIFIALSVAGEKMPWLSTHIAVPFILLTGWWVGQLVSYLGARDRENVSPWRYSVHWIALVVVGILAVLTLRTSLAVNYKNYDYATEYIDYAHGAPGVKWALADIAAIANHTGFGDQLKIAYDSDVSWPMTWYLRDYPNQAYFADQPNRQALDAAVVIAGPKNWTKVESYLGNKYHRFEVTRMWWPLEDYKNLTWSRIGNVLTNPAMRSATWDILWNRDYRRYAQLTGEKLDPPADWPLAERMRIYVQNDIAAKMLSLSLGPNMLDTLPKPVDAYAGVQRSISPVQIINNLGLNGPRGIAVSPNGDIYVADTFNSRIVKLDPKGNLLTTWGNRTPDGQSPPAPGTFIEPWSVAVDSNGYVYVADTWNHRIQKFDTNGKYIQEWGSAGQIGDGQDRFWGPRGLATSSDGRIYVTDTGNKRVAVFDPNGMFLFEFGTQGEGKLNEPVGIAIGSDGRVYVADTWNLRIAVFSHDGRLITSWPEQGWASDSIENKPYLTVDDQGRVYITDPEGYRVIVFSSSGEALAVFGQYGQEENAFGLPVGLAIGEDGKLWVADAANNRLDQYDVLTP